MKMFMFYTSLGAFIWKTHLDFILSYFRIIIKKNPVVL